METALIAFAVAVEWVMLGAVLVAVGISIAVAVDKIRRLRRKNRKR